MNCAYFAICGIMERTFFFIFLEHEVLFELIKEHCAALVHQYSASILLGLISALLTSTIVLSS